MIIWAFISLHLANRKLNFVYIDAFARSGKTYLSNGEQVDGSATISLKYNFDKYYFLEIDKERKNELEEIVKTRFPDNG